MFDWMLPENHAIAILKKDHDTVKGLFEEFEKAETPARRTKIVDQALIELKIHAILEEEIFYPTVRAHVGRDIMNEADEEHHVAKVLIAELDTIDAKNDHRDAKFTVLAESVRHHIREEETRDAAEGQGAGYRFRGFGTADARPQERASERRDSDRRRTRDGGKVPWPCGFACSCRRAQKVGHPESAGPGLVEPWQQAQVSRAGR